MSLSADINRDTGAVSVGNPEEAVRTDIRGDVLYTRHWGGPRWKSELGFRHDQLLYDDSAFRDRDSVTHTLSGAVLHGLNRAVELGVGAHYAMEDLRGATRLDSNTWDIEALLRWQMTGRAEAELALGHESTSYEGDESDSGAIGNAALDYEVTPRWRCRGELRRRIVAADEPGRTGVSTTEGGFGVSYRFTPKLTGSVTPGINRPSGDDQVTELSLDVGAICALRLFDVSLRMGVNDRSSDRDGDDYVAVDAAIRVDVDF